MSIHYFPAFTHLYRTLIRLYHKNRYPRNKGGSGFRGLVGR